MKKKGNKSSWFWECQNRHFGVPAADKSKPKFHPTFTFSGQIFKFKIRQEGKKRLNRVLSFLRGLEGSENREILSVFDNF